MDIAYRACARVCERDANVNLNYSHSATLYNVLYNVNVYSDNIHNQGYPGGLVCAICYALQLKKFSENYGSWGRVGESNKKLQNNC